MTVDRVSKHLRRAIFHAPDANQSIRAACRSSISTTHSASFGDKYKSKPARNSKIELVCRITGAFVKAYNVMIKDENETWVRDDTVVFETNIPDLDYTSIRVEETSRPGVVNVWYMVNDEAKMHSFSIRRVQKGFMFDPPE